MQDLPENHFQVSGASWVNINNYYLLLIIIIITIITKFKQFQKSLWASTGFTFAN